jgi:hypothetical protein
MKNGLNNLSLLSAVGIGLLTSLDFSIAAIYQGHGNGSGGAVISGGTLTLQDQGASFHGAISSAIPIDFNDAVILYIDCRPGGFNNTGSLMDNSSFAAMGISGYNSPGYRALANFAPGFTADFALVLSRNPGSGLYEIAAGPGGTHLQRVSMNFGDSWQFNVNWSDLGITDSAHHYFRFSSSTVAYSGARRLESYETISGISGFNTVNWSDYNEFGIAPVPEPVNMTLAGLGGIFIAGGLVSWLRGSSRHTAEKALSATIS